ncbi:MAG: metal ABC transporter permease [Planctomycetota bacterium]|jgi:manganese/zinc/iron transport system permease protein
MTALAEAGAREIPAAVHEFLSLDLMPLVAVTCAAACLALLGSFLVLRRQAMLGDAMAHSVLPGLVVAFLVTGSRAAGPMLLGAAAAAAVSALVIGAVTGYGRVERSAALGLVYTAMFALGVLLLELSGGGNVDLDVDCVLSGQLELMFWRAPSEWGALLSPSGLAAAPPQALRLLVLLAVCAAAVALAWPLLRAATFDAAFARSRGLRPGWISGGLMGLTTLAIVLSFDAVGSILAVALLTCPPAAARLVTDRMQTHVLLSVGLGAACGLAGYLLATRGAPVLLGAAVDASGTVAALSGLVLAGTAALTSRRGRTAPAGAGRDL